MLHQLRQLEAASTPIRAGLIGAGAMGRGIAWQIAHTPGIELAFIADLDPEIAHSAATAAGLTPSNKPTTDPGLVWATGSPQAAVEAGRSLGATVLIEASNSIAPAARYCLAGFSQGMHAVLMNAEVDLALGALLTHEAAHHDLLVTSDAGDQHGVLATMIDEIELWGFRIVQAGNIKGFLDRDATPDSIRPEAEKRGLSAVQCCAYTDGTKLGIEMALIGNYAGLTPYTEGMSGPATSHVTDVIKKGLFPLVDYGSRGRIDYILGAEPSPGVYVIGYCDDPVQKPYLDYYKLGPGPYYLFYRPYHLCHIETPSAVARLVLGHQPTLSQRHGRLNDVFARAKRDLVPGDAITHGIGGAETYGLVAVASPADAAARVPSAALEHDGQLHATIRRPVLKDAPLSWDDVLLPRTDLVQLFAEQFEKTGIGPDIPGSAITDTPVT